MNWSLKAILARFNGNKTQALDYCARIAENHPHLRNEYRAYFEALLDLSN